MRKFKKMFRNMFIAATGNKQHLDWCYRKETFVPQGARYKRNPIKGV